MTYDVYLCVTAMLCIMLYYVILGEAGAGGGRAAGRGGGPEVPGPADVRYV